MAEIDSITAQIAAGQSLSAEADIGNKVLVGLVLPATWSTASLSFQASVDGGVTWNEIMTVAGAAFAIGSVTGGTARDIAIDPTTLRGVQALKIRSGTVGAPVNQANTVTLTLITRLVF
jgi:hypothetical protein